MANSNLSLTQRAAAGMAWLSGVQVARQLLSIIAVSILARRIPPAIYGLVGMAVLVTNLLESIRDVGTGTALVREPKVTNELASTAFWLNCATGLFGTLLVIVLAWPAARFFREPRLVTVLQLLSVSFFFGAVGVVPTAALNRAMDFRKVAVAQTVGAVSGTLSAILIALAGGTISALISYLLVMSLISTLMVWVLSPFRIKPIFHVDEARRILSFGLHLTGYNVINYFSRNSDNALVGRFLGSRPLGFYQMGYTLMTLPLFNLCNLVVQVTYPALCKFSDDHERFRVAYLRMSSIIALVTFPIMVGLGVTAQPFIRVVLGPKWTAVSELLMVFGPLGALQALASPVNLIYNTQGRPDLLFRWQIFASVSYVGSFIVGLRWGIMGVAVAYTVVWVLLLAPMLAIPFRLIGITLRAFCRALWPITWPTLVMASVTVAWLRGLRWFGVGSAPVQLISTATIGAVLYIGLVVSANPPVLSDLVVAGERAPSPLARRLAFFLARFLQPRKALKAGQANDPYRAEQSDL